MGEHAAALAATQATRRLDIQGLRAIAVLLVVAYHAGLPVPGGFVGVDVFFVISGFVITAMLQREQASTGRIRFGDFYWRRFRRLTPALALAVSVTVLAAGILASPFSVQQTAAKTALAATLLTANAAIALTTGGYFDAPAATNPLLNTWSLSVEEQFYLVFPALIASCWFLAKRHRRARHAAITALSAIAVGSLAITLLSASDAQWAPHGFLFGFYSPLLRAWEFAFGALLALSMHREEAWLGRVHHLLSGVGLSCIIASALIITAETPFPGLATLLPTVGAALVIAGGSGNSSWAARRLASTPLVTVGDASYSVYLWHWPFIALAITFWPQARLAPLAAALLSLIPAIASYRWVERPLRRRSTFTLRRSPVFVFACVLPPVCLSLALGYAAQSGWWWQPVRTLQADFQSEHVGTSRGCNGLSPLSDREPLDCTWNAGASGAPIFLVGDSNADHFGEGMVSAAAALHRPLIISTASSCPFAEVWTVRSTDPARPFAGCREWVRATVRWLSAQRSGTVVISMSDLAITTKDVRLGRYADQLRTSEDAKALALRSGLDIVVQQLLSAGHRVVLVQPVPHFVGVHEFSPSQCGLLVIAKHACWTQMPEQQERSRQASFRRALTSVAEAHRLTVIDLYSEFCSAGACRTNLGNRSAYRDATHISAAASERLSSRFVQALAVAG